MVVVVGGRRRGTSGHICGGMGRMLLELLWWGQMEGNSWLCGW